MGYKEDAQDKVLALKVFRPVCEAAGSPTWNVMNVCLRNAQGDGRQVPSTSKDSFKKWFVRTQGSRSCQQLGFPVTRHK